MRVSCPPEGRVDQAVQQHAVIACTSQEWLLDAHARANHVNARILWAMAVDHRRVGPPAPTRVIARLLITPIKSSEEAEW